MKNILKTISKNKTKKVFFISIISLLLFTLSACALNSGFSEKSSSYSKSDIYFDTIISITIYDTSKQRADEILNECLNICKHYENLFDERNSSSDLYMLNNSNSNECHLNPETIMLLSKGLYYSNESEGKFDITVFPVSSLWDFHEDTATIPSDDDIKKALSHVDYKNLTINSDKSTAILSDPESSIDVGGLAKGYIADKLADYLKKSDITGAIINIGGDIMLIGSKPDNTNYTIGINDPFAGDAPILALSLPGNIAVTTSGTYERKISHGEKTYHHILDSTSGYPCDTDIVSASVISSNATDSDTLCTISILYGSQKALEYLESLQETEGILIKTDGTILYTEGAKKYIINK